MTTITKIVHTLNRGVDKRDIFLDDQDRFRFIHDLFEFNNQENISNNFAKFNSSNDISDLRSHYIGKPRKLLVNIYAFCLMPNHYHLLLNPLVDDGIVRFMRKLNIGYAKYFNEKYERKGALFEGRYKSILVEKNTHFIHLPYYIHLNPLDLISPEWRDRKIKDYKKAIVFLNSYRWSSHLDYIGKKNFPSVTQRDFLLDFFDGPKGYDREIKQWLKEMDVSGMGKTLLE